MNQKDVLRTCYVLLLSNKVEVACCLHLSRKILKRDRNCCLYIITEQVIKWLFLCNLE